MKQKRNRPIYSPATGNRLIPSEQFIALLKRARGDKPFRTFGPELGIPAQYLQSIEAGRRPASEKVAKQIKTVDGHFVCQLYQGPWLYELLPVKVSRAKAKRKAERKRKLAARAKHAPKPADRPKPAKRAKRPHPARRARHIVTDAPENFVEVEMTAPVMGLTKEGLPRKRQQNGKASKEHIAEMKQKINELLAKTPAPSLSAVAAELGIPRKTAARWSKAA